jgi:transcriptional regulator with XRE-family HTH domain
MRGTQYNGPMARPKKDPEVTPDRRALGEALARAREWAGLSMPDVARILGVDRNTVATWDSGLFTPRLDVAIALADHYGITLEALIGRAPLPTRTGASGLTISWKPPEGAAAAEEAKPGSKNVDAKKAAKKLARKAPQK